MNGIKTFRSLTSDPLRFAILVGLTSIPFTVVLSWGMVADGTYAVGGRISGEFVFVAGLLSGYYYSNKSVKATRAGLWTGLAASLGTLLVFLANSAGTVGTLSTGWAVVAIVGTPVVAALGIGLSVLVAVAGAVISDRAMSWFRGSDEPDHRSGHVQDP